MKYFFLLITLVSGTKALSAPELSIYFHNAENRVQAHFIKDKKNFRTELILPNGKVIKGLQSNKSIEFLKKELVNLEEGSVRKECSRQHIVFAVSDKKKTKNYSTCIGARNKQAAAIANLFSVTYATLLK